MKLYIKYMVSIRCKMVVTDELKKLGLHYAQVDLGEIEVLENLSAAQREQFKVALRKSGLELMDDQKAILIEKIRNVITLVAIVFGAAGMFTNCESSASKAAEVLEKETKQDEMFAAQDRVQAQRDSIADYQNFMTEAEATVVKNTNIIADFKVRIMTGKVAMKARYQNRLNGLEKQNNDLRNRLEQYSETRADNWEIFKREWSHDMKRLVSSLNEMEKNSK